MCLTNVFSCFIQVQYYLQLAQQNQQALQQTTQQPQATAIANNAIAGQQQTIQIVQGGGQIQTISVMPTTQLVAPQATAAQNPMAVANTPNTAQQAAPQLALQGLNIQQQQQAQQQQQQQQQLGGIQIVQQIVGPNGEIQQIPV